MTAAQTDELKALLHTLATGTLERRETGSDLDQELRSAATRALRVLMPQLDLELDPEPYHFDVTDQVELRLVNVWARCSRCELPFLIQLRRMGQGLVRNQPQCPSCRGR